MIGGNSLSGLEYFNSRIQAVTQSSPTNHSPPLPIDQSSMQVFQYHLSKSLQDLLTSFKPKISCQTKGTKVQQQTHNTVLSTKSCLSKESQVEGLDEATVCRFERVAFQKDHKGNKSKQFRTSLTCQLHLLPEQFVDHVNVKDHQRAKKSQLECTLHRKCKICYSKFTSEHDLIKPLSSEKNRTVAHILRTTKLLL